MIKLKQLLKESSQVTNIYSFKKQWPINLDMSDTK